MIDAVDLPGPFGGRDKGGQKEQGENSRGEHGENGNVGWEVIIVTMMTGWIGSVARGQGNESCQT